MTELQHLQKVILEIVKDIDDLCKRNNIEYYLFGGSAIGSVRHNGFIPWDDDLDIVMDYHNYEKFINVCRTQLDADKYYFQQALIDWPMLYSKVRLKGTVFEEPGAYGEDITKRGIFVDVFKLDNAPSSSFLRRWQYVCGKYFLSYALLQRGYKEASFMKKVLMYSSYPLKFKPLYLFFAHQLVKYNHQKTDMFVSFGARFRYKHSFFRKDLFSNPIYLPFDNIQLPVPEKYDELLSQLYGDYMTPPPKEQQIGSHLIRIDFGKY